MHQILNEFYKNAPDGLIGNEDCGQMSAWYVLSSMGFYQVCPGHPEYALGAPLFDKIKINLENGKVFEIESPKTSLGKESDFVTSVMLNSKLSYSSAITHGQITNGGKLVFSFIPQKDSLKQFGKGKFMRPHTKIASNLIIPVPVIQSQSKSFKINQEISIKGAYLANANVVYTTDGSEPTRKSALYFKPFLIDTSCIIKAKVYVGKDSSKTTAASFYKAPNNWKITLNCKYNKQYTAGGDDGIIDGIYGETNWRKGEWQGYQSQDFECIIDLGAPRLINSISSNYLQDTRSWIIFPTEIEYFISTDGKKFTSVTKMLNPVAASDYESQLKKFEFHLQKALKARYIKVFAKNFGKLPQWHQGLGGDAFIFIDEIEIK